MADQTFGKIFLEVVGICTGSSVLKASGLSFAMAGRASNGLSKQENEKIVKANKVSVLKAELSLTLDELACKYAGLSKDLLDKTARVSKNSLSEALVAGNEGNDPQDSKHFARRIAGAEAGNREENRLWPPGCGGCLEEMLQHPHPTNPQSPGLCLLFPQAQLPVLEG